MLSMNYDCWVIDTCLDGQDTIKTYLDYFNIQYK